MIIIIKAKTLNKVGKISYMTSIRTLSWRFNLSIL